MPWDCGFDICPPLEPTPSNRALYGRFISELLAKYEYREGAAATSNLTAWPNTPTTPPTPHTPNTPSTSSSTSIRSPTTPTPARVAKVVPKGHSAYIKFLVGELPCIPYDTSLCHYFVRFSSRISSEATRAAEPVIDGVFGIARRIFGSRVKWWNESLEGFEGTGIYDWGYVGDMHQSMMRALERRGMEEVDEEDEEEKDGEEEVEPGDGVHEVRNVMRGGGNAMLEAAFEPRQSCRVTPLFQRRRERNLIREKNT